MSRDKIVQLEERTARLTVLIDPRKKSILEQLCAQEDLTPSQVVRRLIRGYIEQRLGRPWMPGEQDLTGGAGTSPRSGVRRRSTRA
jgi:hypothetical protein